MALLLFVLQEPCYLAVGQVLQVHMFLIFKAEPVGFSLLQLVAFLPGSISAQNNLLKCPYISSKERSSKVPPGGDTSGKRN